METANYSSRLFIEANNPWGMKNPRKRPTTALTGNPYIFSNSAANRNSKSSLDILVKPFGWTGITQDVIQTNWARYQSLEDAAKDIILYLDYFGYKTAYPSLLSFVQEMKAKGYYTESIDEYYKKVIAWKDK